jgi:hypothetical protein
MPTARVSLKEARPDTAPERLYSTSHRIDRFVLMAVLVDEGFNSR